MSNPALVALPDSRWRLYFSSGLVHVPDCGFNEPEYVGVAEGPAPEGPFDVLPDPVLGPEMRSTGEVMGWDRSFPRAFLKAQMGAGTQLPTEGTIFISIRDTDKTTDMIEASNILLGLGFNIVATRGTAAWLSSHDVACETVNKVYEGGLTIVDRLKDGHIALAIGHLSLQHR